VEVLVAFTILATALAISMDLFGSGLRSVSSTREHSRALVFAESLLRSVGHDAPLKSGTSTGNSHGMAWETVVSPYDEWPTVDGLRPYSIVVTVKWAAHQPQINIGSIRLAPKNIPQ
jgi:hypothetical protein